MYSSHLTQKLTQNDHGQNVKHKSFERKDRRALCDLEVGRVYRCDTKNITH